LPSIRQARTSSALKTRPLARGGSRSLIRLRIFADVLGVPVSVARSREIGALGAAIAAGAGIFSGFADGAAAMVRTERFYRPNVSLEGHYARRYSLYRDIADAKAPLWHRLTAVEAAAPGVAA